MSKKNDLNYQPRKKQIDDIYEATCKEMEFFAECFRGLREKSKILIFSQLATILILTQTTEFTNFNFWQTIILGLLNFAVLAPTFLASVFREVSFSPELKQTWNRYYLYASEENGFIGKELDVKEGVAQQHMEACNFSNKKVKKKADLISISLIGFFVELVLIFIFSVFNLM